MNQISLAERKVLAVQHRNIQRFEGDIIAKEIQRERDRQRTININLWRRNVELHIENVGLRTKLKKRSWLEVILGVQRAS